MLFVFSPSNIIGKWPLEAMMSLDSPCELPGRYPLCQPGASQVFSVYPRVLPPVCVSPVLQLRQWPDSYTKKFEHRLYPITFSVGNPQEWKKLFKPCAAQRLFLPVGTLWFTRCSLGKTSTWKRWNQLRWGTGWADKSAPFLSVVDVLSLQCADRRLL
jgi:hypothetical protein